MLRVLVDLARSALNTMTMVSLIIQVRQYITIKLWEHVVSCQRSQKREQVWQCSFEPYLTIDIEFKIATRSYPVVPGS
jgi:hypothetical protein